MDDEDFSTDQAAISGNSSPSDWDLLTGGVYADAQDPATALDNGTVNNAVAGTGLATSVGTIAPPSDGSSYSPASVIRAQRHSQHGWPNLNATCARYRRETGDQSCPGGTTVACWIRDSAWQRCNQAELSDLCDWRDRACGHRLVFLPQKMKPYGIQPFDIIGQFAIIERREQPGLRRRHL